jgi:hypothetical protein
MSEAVCAGPSCQRIASLPRRAPQPRSRRAAGHTTAGALRRRSSQRRTDRSARRGSAPHRQSAGAWRLPTRRRAPLHRPPAPPPTVPALPPLRPAASPLAARRTDSLTRNASCGRLRAFRTRTPCRATRHAPARHRGAPGASGAPMMSMSRPRGSPGSPAVDPILSPAATPVPCAFLPRTRRRSGAGPDAGRAALAGRPPRGHYEKNPPRGARPAGTDGRSLRGDLPLRCGSVCDQACVSAFALDLYNSSPLVHPDPSHRKPHAEPAHSSRKNRFGSRLFCTYTQVLRPFCY